MTVGRVSRQEQSTFPVSRRHHMVNLPAGDLLDLEMYRWVSDSIRDMLPQRGLGSIAARSVISQEEGIPFGPSIDAWPAAKPDLAPGRAYVGQGDRCLVYFDRSAFSHTLTASPRATSPS